MKAQGAILHYKKKLEEENAKVAEADEAADILKTEFAVCIQSYERL